MKVQKTANWILFCLFFLSLFELWRLDKRFESFSPPVATQASLDAYHHVVASSLDHSVKVAFAFTVATTVCLAFTQWRLREELEQLKNELQALKTPQEDEKHLYGDSAR